MSRYFLLIFTSLLLLTGCASTQIKAESDVAFFKSYCLDRDIASLPQLAKEQGWAELFTPELSEEKKEAEGKPVYGRQWLVPKGRGHAVLWAVTQKNNQGCRVKFKTRNVGAMDKVVIKALDAKPFELKKRKIELRNSLGLAPETIKVKAKESLYVSGEKVVVTTSYPWSRGYSAYYLTVVPKKILWGVR